MAGRLTTTGTSRCGILGTMLSCVAVATLLVGPAAAGRPPIRIGTPVGVGKGRLVPLLNGKTIREFCTDRTQVTDSPFTLAPGKWEWSIEAIDGSYAKLDSLAQTSVEAGRTSLRIGLPSRQDLTLAASGWTRGLITSTATLPDVSRSGLGNFEAQWRTTLSGVDSTGAAYGLIASASIPGSSVSPESQKAEASLGMPFALALGDNASLGASTRATWAADVNDTGYHIDWINAVSLHRDITDQLGGFVELVGVVSTELDRPTLGVASAGFDWDLLPHLGLSAGACAAYGASRADAGAFGSLEIHE